MFRSFCQLFTSVQLHVSTWWPSLAFQCSLSGSLCDPGTNHIQPLSTLTSWSATQNETALLSGISNQYASSWCQGVVTSAFAGCKKKEIVFIQHWVTFYHFIIELKELSSRFRERSNSSSIAGNKHLWNRDQLQYWYWSRLRLLNSFNTMLGSRKHCFVPKTANMLILSAHTGIISAHFHRAETFC